MNIELRKCKKTISVLTNIFFNNEQGNSFKNYGKWEKT